MEHLFNCKDCNTNWIGHDYKTEDGDMPPNCPECSSENVTILITK